MNACVAVLRCSGKAKGAVQLLAKQGVPIALASCCSCCRHVLLLLLLLLVRVLIYHLSFLHVQRVPAE